MKKIITLVAAIVMMTNAWAQKSMRDVFLSMPDSISTGLNGGLRKELVDYVGMGAEAKVRNLFQGTTFLDSINDEYASLRLNGAATMQMRLFRDSALGDSAVCVVKTFMAPEAESEVRFYSLDWKPKEAPCWMPVLDAGCTVYEFAERPDTMSVERFEELCKMVEPVMVAAELSSEEEYIKFTLSTPLLNSEEEREVKAVLFPKKYSLK